MGKTIRSRPGGNFARYLNRCETCQVLARSALYGDETCAIIEDCIEHCLSRSARLFRASCIRRTGLRMSGQWQTHQARWRCLPADRLITALHGALRAQSQQHKLEENLGRLPSSANVAANREYSIVGSGLNRLTGIFQSTSKPSAENCLFNSSPWPACPEPGPRLYADPPRLTARTPAPATTGSMACQMALTAREPLS